jgi:hypothetical protein
VTDNSLMFAELPALSELGDRLATAFADAERPERARARVPIAWRPHPAWVAALVFALLATTAAAATLLVLRGSVIPAPERVNLQPPMIVKPDTARLSGVTARDPSGATLWTVRLASSQTGLICMTAGELRGGRFGITGLDGRFRALAPGFTDGCGAAGAPVVGSRVFDSQKRSQVRTVVDGYGGPQLRSAVLESSVGTRRLPVSKDGVFVGVLAGYPEDIGVRVNLGFADGKTETHTFGRSSFVAPDPAGATRIDAYSISGAASKICVRVLSAREVKPFSSGPAACGAVHGAFFFQARRLRQGDHGGRGFNTWHWNHASRTALYGWANKRKVLRVEVVGNGVMHLKPALSGAFQALFPPSVDPGALTVVVTLRNGSKERGRLQAHLVAPPGQRLPGGGP